MWLSRLLVAVFVGLSTRPFVFGLTARGPSAVLHVQTARTSATHPLHASEEVTLWCAPDNLQIAIRKAWFVRKRDKKRFEAFVNPTKKNATLTFASPTIGDAGEYTCELDTQHGRLTNQIHLYGRHAILTCIFLVSSLKAGKSVSDKNRCHIQSRLSPRSTQLSIGFVAEREIMAIKEGGSA
ncbi:hypothetical protein Y032_0526g2949 [Ancylostoma ceylanicum]|uniref:Ig-like domain-containing protein n=1 Tax=Ancylostoma ceylanicum TaxID=53326 RepID=A0A016WSM5_9BILA|nr:hypothetical protein Y032_0526g2949 [Ancylostoma ceylanicum]